MKGYSKALAFLLLAGLLFSSKGGATAEEPDLDFLLEGVRKISAPGIPGPFCLFGEEAFSVVGAEMGPDVRAAVVAASMLGKGRVVVFGHTGYFDGGSLGIGDTGKLVANAIRWTSGKKKDTEGIRVGIYKSKDLCLLCNEQKFKATLLEGEDWYKKIGAHHVLCFPTHSLASEAELAAIRNFVRKGGGLLAAGLAWGWLQLNPGKELMDHPGNRLLTSAGLVWADGYTKRTADVGFSAGDGPMDMIHAARALDYLEEYGAGEEGRDVKTFRQAAWVVTHASQSIPGDNRTVLPGIRRMLKEHAVDAVPTSDTPLTQKMHMARMVLQLQHQEMRDLPPDKITAHPSAVSFPGDVSKTAKRVSLRVEVDSAVTGWHSTGLYAPPGKVVRFQTPPAAIGQGLKARIGAHQDSLWNSDTWRRYPEMCWVSPLNEPWTSLANPFGGLVYIEVPAGSSLGEVAIRICNAVEAPHFILGKTDQDKWLSRIRNRPAPWAELETEKVILTLPSEHVRGLEDPESLMLFWDEVLDGCADLVQQPGKRKRPERLVTDIQISNGYMHAGYPIMTHLDIAEVMVDKERIMAKGHGGVWGLFHELGHNHQSGDWTFSGAGEVTCNLFTLYVFEKVCGIKTNLHESFTDHARTESIKNYLEGGTKFSQWQREPFLALIMYIQLQEAFGWDTFKKVFAEYRDLPAEERPRNDDDKRDQWMVRFSRAAGRNLGLFFHTWGVPTSEEARTSIANLPEWMPDGFPPEEEK